MFLWLGGRGGGGVWQCENANGGQTYAKRMPAGIVSNLALAYCKLKIYNKRKCSSFPSVVLDGSDTACKKGAVSELYFMPGLRICIGLDPFVKQDSQNLAFRAYNPDS
jgi:hypothetical protein